MASTQKTLNTNNWSPQYTYYLFLSFLLVGILLLPIILIAIYHSLVVLISFFNQAVLMPILASSALAGAIGTTQLSNPVHNLLSLISVMMTVVFIFISEKQEFLAFTFLIVYVGAVAILFLFVIMLLNIKELSSVKMKAFSAAEKSFLGVTAALFITALFQLRSAFYHSTYSVAEFTAPTADALIHFILFEHKDIMLFSATLYTHFSALFINISIILFIAMVGAIALTLPTMDRKGTKDTERDLF